MVEHNNQYHLRHNSNKNSNNRNNSNNRRNPEGYPSCKEIK